MNAISNGKLEGWPNHLVTAYVDSGSNVDPTYEAQIILPYLIQSTGRSKEACVAKLKELDFTDAMMESSIGSLSGGWQMKLRLLRAGTYGWYQKYINLHPCSDSCPMIFRSRPIFPDLVAFLFLNCWSIYLF